MLHLWKNPTRYFSSISKVENEAKRKVIVLGAGWYVDESAVKRLTQILFSRQYLF